MPLPGKAPEPPPGKETGKKDERKETGEPVPSQADLEKEGLLRRSKMAELQLRETQTLKALSQMTEPVRASDLTELTGLMAMGIGTSLRILAKGSLAELVDKKRSFGE